MKSKSPNVKLIKASIPKPRRSKNTPKFIVKSKTSKKNIFSKIFGWLNNKLTFSFVPFSDKKGFSFGFRLYALFIVVILISAFIIGSVYLLTSRTVLTSRINDAAIEYKMRTEELQQLKTSITNMLVQIDYNDSITNIFRNSYIVARGVDVFSNRIEIDDIDYINEISNIINDIDVSQKYIYEIMESMEKKETTYNKVPNILPIENHLILSLMSYQEGNENGIYIFALPSTPIRAAANATISSIKYNKASGYEVVLEHSFNVTATYRGIGSLNISLDSKRINKNEIIGYLQSDVFSKGHLDYKIKFANNYINPLFITVN